MLSGCYIDSRHLAVHIYLTATYYFPFAGDSLLCARTRNEIVHIRIIILMSVKAAEREQ